MIISKHFLYLLISGFLFTITAGCAHVGLSAIPQTREGYNKALSTSDNEQFLLNIVRMHYGQTPYFVNVDNMVTQSTLRTSSGSNTQISNDQSMTMNTNMFWKIGTPEVEFTQSPTITYSPLQGTQFISGMLTPIDLDKLSLLIQSGWSTAAVLKLAVEAIGEFGNGTSALHASSTAIPKQSRFNAVADTLDRLEVSGSINYGTTKYNDQLALVVNANDDASAAQLSKVLHLTHPHRQLIFSRAVMGGESIPENIIRIQTRSFFAMLNFLSKGVVASDDEFDDENVIKEKSADINYNWNFLTKNLFLVSVSNSEPENAVTKINYEGRWYFIANQDMASKATLVLLRLIYSLQVGEFKAPLPMITIPVR